MAFELGYGYKSSTLAANINAYYTNWRDKQFQRSVRQPDGEFYSANIEGVNAIYGNELKWKKHKGKIVRKSFTIHTNDVHSITTYLSFHPHCQFAVLTFL